MATSIYQLSHSYANNPASFQRAVEMAQNHWRKHSIATRVHMITAKSPDTEAHQSGRGCIRECQTIGTVTT